MKTCLLAVLVLSLGAERAAAAGLPQAPPVQTQTLKKDNKTVLDKLATFEDFDDLELEDLLNVTVSIAAGRTQTLEDAPSIMSVITDDQMRRTGVRTVAEALRLVPGIVVLMDNTGRGRIAIRGVSSGITSGSSENVLILFNGHRLNEEIDGGATLVNLDIPVDGVKKIEIIRGPGSALFGANAFLGAINIVSYTADTFKGTEVSVGGGSFGTGQVSVLFGKSVEQFSVSGFAQYGRTDGAQLLVPVDIQTFLDRAVAPFGLPPASLAPGRTLDHRRPVNANFTLAYQGLTVNGRVADENAGGYIGWVDTLGTQTRFRTNQVLFDATYRHAVGEGGDVRATVGYTRSAFSQFADLFPRKFALVFPTGGFAIFPDGLLVETVTKSHRVGGEVVFNQQLFARNTLTAGLDVERESTFGLTSRGNFDAVTFAPRPGFGPLPNVVGDSDRRIIGVFAQDTWNPVPAIGITAGVRSDHYNDFGNVANPRVGLVWRLLRDFNLKVLYGRAFRAPSFTELSVAFPGVTGNPALRPATINTVEAALGYKRGNLRISGNVYGDFLRDLIVIDRPVRPLETSRFSNNRAGVNASGVEIEARRVFGHTNWFQVGYAYQHSTDQSTGQRVQDIPIHLGNLGGSVGLGRYLNVTPMVYFRGSLGRGLFDPRPAVDGYTLFNLSVQAHNLVKGIELSATVDNAFDKPYFDPSPITGVPGDYPRPGSRFFVKASWRF